jgi:acetyl-CoA synthetase
MISPLPGATPIKPACATFALPGIIAEIIEADGTPTPVGEKGFMCITRPWPSMIRNIWNDPERFKKAYFGDCKKDGKPVYFTGDGAMIAEDGYITITGRTDDVINVSGHRMGTAEVESALVLNKHVAEAAVVGYPHDIKGQGIYAYVTLNIGIEPSEALKKELIQLVRQEIGPIATPDIIQWAPGLPKTRSGKIMRRILRKVAANEVDNLGDISTLAEPSVVDEIIEHRANK